MPRFLPIAASLLILSGLAASSLAREPVSEVHETLLIDDFERDVRNQLGGLRNSFVKAPSVVKAKRVIGDAHDVNGLCAKITARQAVSGFCGYWVHFFDRSQSSPTYLDASQWHAIAFRVRGQSGGEDLLVKLSDAEWAAKQDSVPVGLVSDLLPGGITTDWREVQIPLSSLKRLDVRQLAGISFKCESTTEQTVFIDDIHLKRRPQSVLPVSQRLHAAQLKHPAPPRALWVWSTEELIQSPSECRELFEVCSRDGIGRLWVQAPYDRLQASCVLRRPTELRRFLAAAHQRGISVEALDGYPEFALREHHDKPLSLIDAIRSFNEQSAANERFDGIHFDNEPYVILGWHDPLIREQILHDFLTLNVECQQRARAGGMQFGVDLPFWWQSQATPQSDPVGAVTFRGVRKPASHHCIDLLDNVGIMNYRDSADGSDGMLRYGRELLTYSDGVPHARIHLGIETFIEQPAAAHFVVGLPIAEFRAALLDRGAKFARLSRVNDWRLCRLDDGERVHVGLSLPDELTPAEQQLAARTLIEIARAFGHLSSPRSDFALLSKIEEHIQHESEWQSFSRADIRDDEFDATFLGFKSNAVMPSKVTFGDDSLRELHEEVDFAERGFRQYRSYAGIAVHCWESYRKLRR